MTPEGSLKKGSFSQSVVWLSAAAMFSASPVFALSDLEIREKRSAEINSIKKTDCAGESADVRKLVEYAAALVFHNEIEEARISLESAIAQAKSQSCKDGLSRASGGL